MSFNHKNSFYITTIEASIEETVICRGKKYSLAAQFQAKADRRHILVINQPRN
ncbi:hypothetical protein BN1221_04194 [Brenneria goodwinii]|uniref:Uncharacterized protein n=1 Tax=Brenneria goodwinii TaxID=1109412 RepID=A0A0G4K0R3_9GAMM|nr:hypothetical protein BN1221_04194 [Brenneria goodwinii]